MEDIVKQKFGELISHTSPEGEIHVAIKDYLPFVKRCFEERIPILGMEAFERRPNGFCPRIDLIADYSDLTKDDLQSFIEKSYKAAMDFFRYLPQQDNLYICFAFPSKETLAKVRS